MASHAITGWGTKVFAERNGSVSIVLQNQDYKGNGKEINMIRAIDISIRPDAVVTAQIELLSFDILMQNNIEPKFMVQNKEIERIIYKDGSVFPPVFPEVPMVERNRTAMLDAGISRIH